MTVGAPRTISRTPRPAARILLIDADGRILLFRFDPPGRPPFWCTPGGALEPGESYAAAARRELIEETGIAADPGLVVERKIVEFETIEGVPVIADECYFLVRAPSAEIDVGGHTPLEREVMREWRWFDTGALTAIDEPFFPTDLPLLLARLTMADRDEAR